MMQLLRLNKRLNLHLLRPENDFYSLNEHCDDHVLIEFIDNINS